MHYAQYIYNLYIYIYIYIPLVYKYRAVQQEAPGPDGAPVYIYAAFKGIKLFFIHAYYINQSKKSCFKYFIYTHIIQNM